MERLSIRIQWLREILPRFISRTNEPGGGWASSEDGNGSKLTAERTFLPRAGSSTELLLHPQAWGIRFAVGLPFPRDYIVIALVLWPLNSIHLGKIKNK